MTREEAFKEINKLQDEYIDELIALMNNKAYDSMKMLNFTSATGTGKTKMMSKLINRFPDYYFIITTLSKGQLHLQIRDSLNKDCNQDNFYVYGSADYKINSKLDAKDIISKIPSGSKCIWLRDEGHIRTNRWDELLLKVCYKVINFSATNTHSDIQCNFTSTMMLRTVNQTNGTPEDAINKLLEIKEAHKNVPNYNPCAIFRCVSGDKKLYDMIVNLCKKHKLKHIDITDDEFVMKQLCEDDNENDVIINKFKIVEGIDIRRAHVLYMDNQPGNNATTIQVIGRCRRNALLYRKDIDILSPKNENLLNQTRECYVYYNVEKMKVDEDENGELQYAFCNHISCQSLKANTKIEVINGQMQNGLFVLELKGKTGKFKIDIDQDTGFNIINPITQFYKEEVNNNIENYIYTNASYYGDNYDHKHKKIHINVLKSLIPIDTYYYESKYHKNQFCIHRSNTKKYQLNGHLDRYGLLESNLKVSDKVLDYFYKHKFSYDFLKATIRNIDSYGKSLNNKNEYYNIAEELKNNEKSKLYKHYSIYYKDIISQLNKSNLPDFIIIYYIICLIYINRTAEYAEESSTYSSTYFSTKDKEILESKGNLLNIETLTNDILDFLNDYKNDKLSRIEKENYIKMYFYRLTDRDTFRILLGLDYSYSIYDMLSYRPNLDIHFRKLESMYNYNLDKINNIVTTKDIKCFFDLLYMELLRKPFLSIYNFEVLNIAINLINEAEQILLNKYGFIQVNYSNMFEDITLDDLYRIRAHIYPYYSEITEEQLNKNKYLDYYKQINDKESAIIGVDLMKQIKDDDNNVFWIESRSVSSKVGNYNKFNTFISNHYSKELEQAKIQYTKGKNNFVLDKKCNAVIGYCVEYYSKYLLFGEEYLDRHLIDAKLDIIKLNKYDPNNEKQFEDQVVIRACMLKYKENMCISFGNNAAKIIKTISVNKLIEDDYQEFVNIVKTLGRRVANFVKVELYQNQQPINNIDPNLSIRHIAGLADYITEDTILDVKVNGNLNEGQVKQVLAYHYLSTKRSDLNIKRVIVYDATSGKHVSIDIEPENWKENCKYGYKEK